MMTIQRLKNLARVVAISVGLVATAIVVFYTRPQVKDPEESLRRRLPFLESYSLAKLEVKSEKDEDGWLLAEYKTTKSYDRIIEDLRKLQEKNRHWAVVSVEYKTWGRAVFASWREEIYIDVKGGRHYPARVSVSWKRRGFWRFRS